MKQLLAVLCVVLLALCATATVHQKSKDDRRRIPVIIDTDIGQDFDDTFGVSYALTNLDTIDLRLVLTAQGNTTGRAILLTAFIEHAVSAKEKGAVNVDVGIGIMGETPHKEINGVGPEFPWVPKGFTFANYTRGRVYPDGVRRAVELLETEASEDHPFIVIGLAPYTNLGLIFRERPDLRRRVIFVTMGGSVYHGYGPVRQTDEYNIRTNLSMSQVMFNETKRKPFAAPLCVAPTDSTWWFQIYGENFARFRNGALRKNGTLAAVLYQNFAVWLGNGGGYGGYRPFNASTTSGVLYDLQATWQGIEVARRLREDPWRARNDLCARMPFLLMQNLDIVVNGTGFTNIVSVNNTEVGPTFQAIAWLAGNKDGTYPLGATVIDAILRFNEW